MKFYEFGMILLKKSVQLIGCVRVFTFRPDIENKWHIRLGLGNKAASFRKELFLAVRHRFLSSEDIHTPILDRRSQNTNKYRDATQCVRQAEPTEHYPAHTGH